MQEIGFMQGRLSPLVDGRIQAFPWDCWQQEFRIGQENGFRLIEWTLDQDRLYENPLMTAAGQDEIRALCRQYDFTVFSLTGDCFMQAPFWKVDGAQRLALQADFMAIARACAAVGITMMVVPLVDNGRIDIPEQENVLVEYLESQSTFFAENGLKIVFESDFKPPELARFIGRLDAQLFGVNHDIGNSASLGMDPAEEFAAFGHRILNVHIKDRVLGGTTVPLGTGNADFDVVFTALGRIGYRGNFILQTARATEDNHAEVLCRYRDMALSWLEHHAT